MDVFTRTKQAGERVVSELVSLQADKKLVDSFYKTVCFLADFETVWITGDAAIKEYARQAEALVICIEGVRLTLPNDMKSKAIRDSLTTFSYTVSELMMVCEQILGRA